MVWGQILDPKVRRDIVRKVSSSASYWCQNWPQLRRAPIKFGRFIELYNINDKVLYKQTDMGFAAKAGFFWGGERGRFAPKKGITLHLRAMDFREKKILRKLNTYCKLL